MATAGYRSYEAVWIGGASAIAVIPPLPPVPVIPTATFSVPADHYDPHLERMLEEDEEILAIILAICS